MTTRTLVAAGLYQPGSGLAFTIERPVERGDA